MQIEIGFRYPTKDGRKIGNAQVIGIDTNTEECIVRTDFGNIVLMPKENMDTLFHPSFEETMGDELNVNPVGSMISPEEHLEEQLCLLGTIKE